MEGFKLKMLYDFLLETSLILFFAASLLSYALYFYDVFIYKKIEKNK